MKMQKLKNHRRKHNPNHISKSSKQIIFRVKNADYYHYKETADEVGLSVNQFARTVFSGKFNNAKLQKMKPNDRKVLMKNQRILKSDYGGLMSEMSSLESQIKRIGVNVNNYIHSYFKDRKAGKSPDFYKTAMALKAENQQQLTVYRAADSRLEKELTKLWQLLQ